MIKLLETTRFRVGNAEYARLNRSFGLSTLRRRHAEVSGTTIRFRFRGKGGQMEERALVDRRLAAVVRRCQELPGQALFQYVDDVGEAHAVNSEDVNDYLREAAGTDEFTAKDFRTWAATVLAYRALQEVQLTEPGKRPGNAVRAAIQRTADAIGDTATVTRSSYVHPAVIEAYEAADPPSPMTDRPRPAAGDAQPTRRHELEVIRLLRSRRASAPSRAVAATRSQVRRSPVAGRVRRRSA